MRQNWARLCFAAAALSAFGAMAAPDYATWDVTNSRWQFFDASGAAYAEEWTDGITSDIEVRFSSVEEFNAIKAESVTPKAYVLTGLTLAAGSATYDLTGLDFTVPADTVIDLKGNTLKLPNAALTGTPFTVTDSSATTTNLDASVAQSIATPSVLSKACFWLDALDTSTLNIDADGKVQTWTSKDANHVVATATTAPTYSATGYDVPTVDFGTTGSGLDMSYTRFANLRTVFWVVKIESNINAFLLGDTSTYNFHRGDNGAYGYLGNAYYCRVWNGTTPIESWSKKCPSPDRFEVISATMNFNSSSDRLTNDRNIAGRNGGRQLSELICFDTILSDAARREVAEYLQQKWFAAQKTWTTVTGGGELVIDVPEGTTLVNSSLTLTGSAKLVKTGAGMYQSGVAQTYEGGTRVEAGTLALNAEQGLGSGDITVAEGATFDVNGRADTTNNVVVLDGGTLANTGTDLAETADLFKSIRLTKNSTIQVANDFGLVGEATGLSLGGNKLTISIANGKTFTLGGVAATAGTVELTGSGTFKTVGGGMNAKTTAFQVGTAFNLAAPLVIGDYATTYTGDADTGMALLTVRGTYKPANATAAAFTLGEGSTLDLSDLTETLDGSALTFASDPSVVTVALGTRSFTDGDKIVSWSAAPANAMFYGSGDNLGDKLLDPQAAGLVIRALTSSEAVWTSTTDGDTYALADNWSNAAVPASGKTYYVRRGASCVDPFAQGTVTLQGTLDLGGATQNFTTDIDNVIPNGVILKNGTYNLTACVNLDSRAGHTFTVDKGAVLNFAGRLYFANQAGGGNSVVFVRNGGYLNMPLNTEHQLGRYKNNTFYLWVQDGSRLSAVTLRVGWDTNGAGDFRVQNKSVAVLTGMLKMHGRDNGSGCGYATVLVQNNSRLQVDGGICYGIGYAGGMNFVVDGGSVLETSRIYGYGTTDPAYFCFNNATFVPNTAGVNIFDDTYSSYRSQGKASFHITGNMLTVSNVVGKVTVGAAVDGVGSFRLTGGQDLEFTAVPTYTGATTVEAGTLTYPGSATTSLAVTNGATFAYTSDIPSLASATFESGATLKMNVVSEDGEANAAELTVAGEVNVDGVVLVPTGLESWNQVESRVMTATAITGTPVVPDGLKAEIINNSDGTASLWLMDANMLPIAQRPITATYLGDGDTNGYTTASNWICYNSVGGVVEGAVPVYYTTVVLANDTAFTYPADLATTFPLKGLTLATNVTLTADCDWKYFQPITIPDGCTLNLGGHTLDMAISAAQAAQVKGTGKITVDVPANTTETMDADEWGFAKTGAGELKVRVTETESDKQRALSLNAGRVTIVDATDGSQTLTNVFSTATTGIAGTLDLGGTVQTFANVMDGVYNNGAVTINGTLLLTNGNWTSLGAKTITFGTNLVMTCWNHLGAPYGSPTINFQDGCHCEFVNGEHQLGTYRSPRYYINVTSKAYVHITGYLRLGAGIYSWARLLINDATVKTDNWIDLGTRVSGSQNGDGELNLQNGAYLECYGIHASGRTDLGGGDATLLLWESTLKCRYNRLWGYQNNRFYSYFRNAVIIPTVSSTEANEELFYHYNPQIQSGFLTISNTVGLVRINTMAYGAGGFEVAGGSTNVECVTKFEVAPTYTGTTKVTGGTLYWDRTEQQVVDNVTNDVLVATHGSTNLVVGAKGVYATDVSDATWKEITFEEGATVQRTTKDDVLFTADKITGTPKVDSHYYIRQWTDDEHAYLKISYQKATYIFLR